MDHVSEQERQEPLCLSVLGIPFRHSRNRAILGRFDVRGIIILPTRFKGVQRRYTACMNVLNVNVDEIAKSRLEFKKLFNLFQSLFNLQEPVALSLLEVSAAVRPTRKNQNRKSRCTVSVQYQNEVLQNKSVSFLVLESINLYIESINLNIV